MNLNDAELIGLHIGDGTLYKTNRSLVWELRGDKNLEKTFYDLYITKLLKNIFNIDISPKFRKGGKNGCYGIQTSNKKVTSFFLKYNFPIGKKSHIIDIPNFILNESFEIKKSVRRGLFDTDGCLRYDKGYPRIEFGFVSIKLIESICTILEELGYRYHKWGNKYYKVCINGKYYCKKFFLEIKPKNIKHLNKVKF
jgi:hypothetical protein